jgi:hypothetical protein
MENNQTTKPALRWLCLGIFYPSIFIFTFCGAFILKTWSVVRYLFETEQRIESRCIKSI